MGATPRPLLVPTGALQPWEGSVRGGRGSSRTEPSVFLCCVGGSDPVPASGSSVTPVPAAQPHGQSQHRAQRTWTHTGLCWITCARAVPSLGHSPQRLWGADCGAHRAMGTAPTPQFLAHSHAGCQLCRDFAFPSTPGVFQCLFSYGAAPVLLSRALPEVPPAWRALQLCQTCHRLGHGTVLMPPNQLAQRQAELEGLEPSLPGCWEPLSWGSTCL